MAAKKKYVVADGYSFTAGGHIYTAGEDISEDVFADKKFFASCLSKGSIKAEGTEATADAVVEKSEDAVVETTEAKKISKSKDKE